MLRIYQHTCIVTAGLWRVKHVPVQLFLFWSLPRLQTFWLSTPNTKRGGNENFWGGSNSSITECMVLKFLCPGKHLKSKKLVSIFLSCSRFCHSQMTINSFVKQEVSYEHSCCVAWEDTKRTKKKRNTGGGGTGDEEEVQESNKKRMMINTQHLLIQFLKFISSTSV